MGLIQKIVPIRRDELLKFLCTASMIFLIAYIHHTLRISKDALIISRLGAENISAIKVWIVLPVAFLFTLLYIKLSDVFTRKQLFHIMNWFFISYFILFTLVLYPNSEALTIDISEATIAQFPAFKYIFKIFSNWHYCLFFVFAELMVTTMLSITFWQLANHITSIEESKRFYPLFGFISQLGLMLSGILSKYFGAHSVDWQATLDKVTISVVIAGALLSSSMGVLSKVIGTAAINTGRNLGALKTKNEMSLKESLKYIISSKPILLITALILCYNISLNLVEGVWKKSTEIFFSGNANQIHHFMANVNLYESLLTMLFALTSVYILRRCKWKTAALIVPAAITVIGSLFFLFLFFKGNSFLLATGVSVLTVAVYFGAAYSISSKSMKHSLFDSTKEMAYIPLPDELKTKGKAAAEMIGIRLGKGSGAFIQQILLMVFTNLTLLDFAPVFSLIFVILIGCWYFSVASLSRRVAT